MALTSGRTPLRPAPKSTCGLGTSATLSKRRAVTLTSGATGMGNAMSKSRGFYSIAVRTLTCMAENMDALQAAIEGSANSPGVRDVGLCRRVPSRGRGSKRNACGRGWTPRRVPEREGESMRIRILPVLVMLAAVMILAFRTRGTSDICKADETNKSGPAPPVCEGEGKNMDAKGQIRQRERPQDVLRDPRHRQAAGLAPPVRSVGRPFTRGWPRIER